LSIDVKLLLSQVD